MPTDSDARLSVDRPTRSADRNRDVVDGPADETRLLPSLDPGITLLDVEGGRGVTILQSLVLDHLLTSDGPAFWVDAAGHATTTVLARLAPSQRLLDRISVARGFTAYQHYAALCDLPTAVDRTIADSDGLAAARRRRRTRPDHEPADSPHTPSLVVAPALDTQYRDDDTLAESHAATLQARALARLRTYAEGYDVPVLLTRTTADAFTDPVERMADRHLRCVKTELGPRFVGGEFETRCYPTDGGYQTTLAYWRDLLGTRARRVGLEPAPSGPGESGGETGATADGAASPTANPLLDAWTAGGR